MKITNDVLDFLFAEAVFERRHDVRAWHEDHRANHSVSRGRAAWKVRPLENSCEVRRNFRKVQASSVMAAAAVQLKQSFPPRNGPLSSFSRFIAARWPHEDEHKEQYAGRKSCRKHWTRVLGATGDARLLTSADIPPVAPT